MIKMEFISMIKEHFHFWSNLLWATKHSGILRCNSVCKIWFWWIWMI